MKVAITGASGFIGSALADSLASDGHQVQRLVRGTPKSADEVGWQPRDGTIDVEKLVGTDAVVHLAAEPLVGLRWTEEKKRRVLQSRVDGTSLIARAMADLDGGPQTLVSISAVGYYGDTREWVDEDSPPGEGFLARVCAEWEAAADAARDAGVRVVHPRLGLVLAKHGGILEQMLTPFKLGLGGPVGDGSQYFAWIAIEDAIGAIRLMLESDLHGPVNVVAPNPVTNAEFTRALGDALNRPAFVRLPKFAVRAALGEMGQETLLAGQRVRPTRLLDAGFEFQFSHLEHTLAHIFG